MKRISRSSQLAKLNARRLKHRERRLEQRSKYLLKWQAKTPITELSSRRARFASWTKRAKRLRAPRDFVLFKNPEKVIDFFKGLERVHRKGHDAYLELENVAEITADTILLMVSRTVDLRFNHGRSVGGRKPTAAGARAVFEESGLFGDKVFDLAKIRNTKGSIARHKDFVVSPETAAYLISRVVDYFSSREDSAAAYETLIELMQNTNMHAGGSVVENELWWSSVYCLPDKTLFNFLDNGRGICHTATKRLSSTILRTLGIKDNADLLKDILDDKVASRTGKFYHGRGLPLIRKRTEKGLLKNVVVITNNVYANVSTGEFRILNTDLQGTFFHWEIEKPKTLK